MKTAPSVHISQTLDYDISRRGVLFCQPSLGHMIPTYVSVAIPWIRNQIQGHCSDIHDTPVRQERVVSFHCLSKPSTAETQTSAAGDGRYYLHPVVTRIMMIRDG